MKEIQRNWLVGKDIGGCIYVHENYVNLVIESKELSLFMNLAKTHPDYQNIISPKIFKIKKDYSSISIISCPDFNESDEPYIKNWLKINKDGTMKFGKSNPDNPQIYHHKWLFVEDSYTGFDIQNSKERSKYFLNLKMNRSKIGYKKYWDEIIKQDILSQL